MPKKGKKKKPQPSYHDEAERTQYLLSLVEGADRQHEDEEYPISVPMTVLPERCLAQPAPIPAGRTAKGEKGLTVPESTVVQRGAWEQGAFPLGNTEEDEAFLQGYLAATLPPDLLALACGGGQTHPAKEEPAVRVGTLLPGPSYREEEEEEYFLDDEEEEEYHYSAYPNQALRSGAGYSVEAPSEEEYYYSEEEGEEAELSEYGEEEACPYSAYTSQPSRAVTLYSVEAPSEEEMDYYEEGEGEEYDEDGEEYPRSQDSGGEPHSARHYAVRAPSDEEKESHYQSEDPEESERDCQEEGERVARTPSKRQSKSRNKRHACRGAEAKPRHTAAARYQPHRPQARRTRFWSSQAGRPKPRDAGGGKPAEGPTTSSARGRVAPPPARRKASRSPEGEAAEAATKGAAGGAARGGRPAAGPAASSAKGREAPLPAGPMPAAQEGSTATGPSPFCGWGFPAGMPGNPLSFLSSFVYVPVTVFVFVPLFPFCVFPVPVTVPVLVPRTFPNLSFPSMFPGMVR